MAEKIPDSIPADQFVPDEEAPDSIPADQFVADKPRIPATPEDPATTQPTEGAEELSLASKALDYAGRGLDYAGGMVRTGLVNSPAGMGLDALQSYLRGKPMVGGPNHLDDIGRAIKGKAPRTAEYLERAGMPEGGHLSDAIPGLYTSTPEEGENFWRAKLAKGGLLDPTARGTLGTIGDMATDPLSYVPLTKLAEAPGALAKLARGISQPVAEGVEGLGNAYYKSAFKRPDAAVGDFIGSTGKKLPSEIAMDKGLWGSDQGIEKQVKSTVGDVTAEKKAIFPQIKNQAIDPAEAWSPELIKKIETLKADPTTEEVADKALEQMAKYGSKGPVTPDNIWLYQKNLTRKASAGSNAFKEPHSFDHWKEVEKQMAKDLGDMLQREAENTSPELGQAFKDSNSELSPLLRSQKAFRSGAKNEANRKGLGSQVGAMLLAGGAGAAPFTHGASLLPAAGLYGMKAAASPAARTGGGLMLNRIGQGLGRANIDALLRQKVIDASRAGSDNVWGNAANQNQGGEQ